MQRDVSMFILTGVLQPRDIQLLLLQQRKYSWRTWRKYMRTFDEGHQKNGTVLPKNEATKHRRISVTDEYAKSLGFRRGIPEYVRSCVQHSRRNSRRKTWKWLRLLVPRLALSGRRWKGLAAEGWLFCRGLNRCSPCCGNSFGCWFKSFTTLSCQVRVRRNKKFFPCVLRPLYSCYG